MAKKKQDTVLANRPARQEVNMDDFRIARNTDDTTELLEVKAFNKDGVTTDVNHISTLAKIEVWTDKPRFFLKRLVSNTFFDPWNYNKGKSNDVTYLDIYGRQAKWVEVSAQVFQLYERFVLGEEVDGRIIHNNLLFAQAEHVYKGSLN